jgi:hypothetical protein
LVFGGLGNLKKNDTTGGFLMTTLHHSTQVETLTQSLDALSINDGSTSFSEFRVACPQFKTTFQAGFQKEFNGYIESAILGRS